MAGLDHHGDAARPPYDDSDLCIGVGHALTANMLRSTPDHVYDLMSDNGLVNDGYGDDDVRAAAHAFVSRWERPRDVALERSRARRS